MHKSVALGLGSLFLCAGVLFACSSTESSTGGDDDDADDDDTSSSGGGAVSTATCTSRCETRTKECSVPEEQIAQVCSNLCDGSVTTAALECIEALSCSADEDDLQACVTKNPPGSSSSGGASSSSSSSGAAGGGKEGDACTCDDVSGEWECSGTGICSTGLVCQGTGTGSGTCVQICCTSKDDCTAKLGKEAECGSGQTCECRNGIECVGDDCKCPGDFIPSRAYCSDN